MWRESNNCSCNKWPLWISKLSKESSRCQDVFAKAFFSLCKFTTTLCSMKLREFIDSNPFLTMCLHSGPKVQNSKVHKVHVNLMYSSVFCEHRDSSKPLIMNVKHNCWKKVHKTVLRVGKETNVLWFQQLVTFRSDAKNNSDVCSAAAMIHGSWCWPCCLTGLWQLLTHHVLSIQHSHS
jgi:hypothetical protein